MKKADPREGFVLVAVLWVIALLSALAMASAISFRGFAGAVAIDRDRVVADAMLTAGLEASAAIMIGLRDSPLTERETSVSLPAGMVQIRLNDEGGRIDINKAPVKVLANLLRSIGADDVDTIVQGIEGWRAIVDDSSFAGTNSALSNSTTSLSGGTDPQNNSVTVPEGTSLPQGAQAKDNGIRAFTDTRQLALIPGMTPEYLAEIEPLITVFGYAKINALTAPPEVIAALPELSDVQVAAYLDARQNPVGDDWLQGLLGGAKDYAAVKGRAIAGVELTVKLLDGYSTKAKAVIAVVPGDSQPYRVLVWTPISTIR